MGSGFVAASGKVEPYQLLGVQNAKAVQSFGGHIDTTFGSGCANKEYFLLCNKFLQFSIQFCIKFSQSFMIPPSIYNCCRIRITYLADKMGVGILKKHA